MDRKTLNVALASVLTTLDELAPHDLPAPKSIIYLALQHGLGISHIDCGAIEDLLVGNGLVKTTPETIDITNAGRAMAQRCNAMLAESARPEHLRRDDEDMREQFARGREDD